MKQKLLTMKENIEITVTEDTKYILHFPKVEDGEYSVSLVFEKSGVVAEIVGLYRLKKGQKVSLVTTADHRVPHTSCDVNIKCVLEDNTESTYVGRILINKSAQQTSSFLHDAVLVLGDNTKNRSDPILEIEANDVKASHGATTGRIDESQIYYLQSRGLSKKESEELIVNGFFDSAMSELDKKVVTEISPQIN